MEGITLSQNALRGLGVMGFAEMLIRLGISYATDEAVQAADKIAQFIALQAEKASKALCEV